jgi:hypothetical protein
MSPAKVEVIESIPLCDGELSLVLVVKKSPRYEEFTAGQSNLSVHFRLGDRKEILTDLAGLKKLIVELKCDLVTWVQGREKQFAQIIAPILKLGRVISSEDLYSFLDPQYGIRVAEHLPTLDQKTLRFLCGRFGLDIDSTLLEVALNLESLELNQRAVARKFLK